MIEETKQKLSKANMGKTPSEETRKKISIASIGRKPSEVSKYKNKIKRGIRVITQNCCYYSLGDASKELHISTTTFYKLFEKDSQTGFFIENKKKNEY